MTFPVTPRALPFAAIPAILLFASSGFAHISMTSPTPRSVGMSAGAPPQGQKDAPCGVAGSQHGENGVTVFAPGQTITVTWDEIIQHDSYYRISFDSDGDDGFTELMMLDAAGLSRADDTSVDMKNATEVGLDATGTGILLFVDDGNMMTESFSVEVTLPDIECENCTLQLIQFMYGRQDAYYHQCADLALRAGGDMGAGGMGAGGMAAAGMAGADMGAGGMAGAGMAGGGMAGMMMGGAAGAAMSGASGMPGGGAGAGGVAGMPPVAGGGTGGVPMAVSGGAAGVAGAVVQPMAGTAAAGVPGVAGAAVTPATGGAGAVATTGTATPPLEGVDSGGCAIVPGTRAGQLATGLLALFGFGLLRRRRARWSR